MPLNLVYILAAGRILKDSETGKRTLVDIFDIIYIPKGQTVTYEILNFAGKIKGIEGGSATIEVLLEDPNKAIIAKQTLNGTNLSPGSIDFNVTFPLLEFSKQELYFIRVKYNGELIPDQNRNSIFVYKII